MRRKKIKSNNKRKRNSNNRFLSFIKKYSIVITIIVSILPILVNFILYYKEKRDDTAFITKYYALSLKEDNVDKENSYYQELIDYPTLNTDITKILNASSIELKDYHVIYFVLKQVGNTPSKNLVITLNKTKDELSSLNSLDVDYSFELITEKIDYPLEQQDGIKIPIGICKASKIDFTFSDCIIERYYPLEISYNNKYLFSSKKESVREFQSINLIVDGEMLGMGGELVEKEWYQKR